MEPPTSGAVYAVSQGWADTSELLYFLDRLPGFPGCRMTCPIRHSRFQSPHGKRHRRQHLVRLFPWETLLEAHLPAQGKRAFQMLMLTTELPCKEARHFPGSLACPLRQLPILLTLTQRTLGEENTYQNDCPALSNNTPRSHSTVHLSLETRNAF